MIKDELAKLALNFVSIPDDFKMIIENYGEHEASFVWAADDLDEGISVTLDTKGKLLELSTSIVVSSGIVLSVDDKKRIAEQFLREQHPEALAYLTFSYSKEKEECTRFVYEQFVGGYPLHSHNCAIEVSHAGEVVKFHYNRYAKKLPALPKSIIEKEKVIEQNLHTTNWNLKLSYLSDEMVEIEKSGLYMIYESDKFFHSYDACTGETNFKTDFEESDVSYESIPVICSEKKYDTVEEIVGIPNTMELLREVDDGDEFGMVWREKDWQSPNDLSFNSFLSNRAEDTVKVKVDKETKRVKEFCWFKKRTGALQLSYEECKEIASTFIGDYFTEYIPYLLIEKKEEAFNEAQKAFFTFPLHNGNGVQIEGEHFYVSVNRTTGLIDLLMGPKVSLNQIKQFQSQLILPIEKLSVAFKEIDANLRWSKEYDKEEPYEKMKYAICHRESKKKIVGVNAYTGEVILYKN